MQHGHAMIKTICVLALGALVVGCHLDKLLTGSSGGPRPTSHAPPAGLRFTTQPESASVNQLIRVDVSVVDSAGIPVAGAETTMVVVALESSPGGATLGGTKTAHPVRGVASFPDLSLNQAGTYTLKASALGFQVSSAPITITPAPPTTGDLTVTTSTTGTDLDPDGYTVSLDGTTSQPIPSNSSGVTFASVPAGSHSVTLSGVASNCSVSGGTSHDVNITAGQPNSTAFSVTCTAIPPTTGSITVTTSTTGSDLDSDGYTVTVDAGNSQSIPTNSSGGVTFNNLSAGNHPVELSGVASNCSVTGGASHTVTVIAGQTISHTFSVSCTAIPPTTGDLVVSTTTGGSDLDPDGYTVTVDGASQAIGTSGNVTFSTLPAGAHTVGLSGVAANCAVSGQNPRSANVPAGGVGHADFAITCVAPPPPQDHAPVVNAGGDHTILLSLGSFTLNASFTDQDGDGPWSYTINWGDGSSTSNSTPNQGGISASHSYGLASTNTLTVTVTDAHGLSGSDQATITVVVTLSPPRNP